MAKKNSALSDVEKLATTPAVEVAAAKVTKQKPVVETIKKYGTRRSTQLQEVTQVEHKPQTKASPPSLQEKVLVKDIKASPSKHTNLESSTHKEKSKPKPSQINIKDIKQSKSPSKTPTKSPSKTPTSKSPSKMPLPTRSPSTRLSAKSKSSSHTSTSTTPHVTRSHAKNNAKAMASNNDPIPVWITWKCCLCSRGSSQDQLGFLYGPYKSLTDDTLLVGSKRTHDDADDESSNTEPELWVHEGCACWAPGVCLVGSELRGLAEAVKNARDMVHMCLYYSL